MSQQTIMVIDDEQKNLMIMEALLCCLDHRVISVSNGREALELITKDPPDLILLDIMMPDMNGYNICHWLKSNERTRLIPVIMVTALDQVPDKIRAFDLDADDYITKPVNRQELIARVRSCLRIKALNDRLECSESVMFAFAQAVEAKDPYTIGHSDRVSVFSTDLGFTAGIPKEQIADLKKGGLLHDIGKIGVPDAVLQKPGKFTPEEREVMERHPVIGEKICKPLRSIGGILPLIRSHHERLDGSGYPDGLKGEEISISVRILAIADTYDAVSSDRPYRPRMPQAQVIRILREDADQGRLDRELVALALSRLSFWEEAARSDDLEAARYFAPSPAR